jgi:hypothetical protein
MTGKDRIVIRCVLLFGLIGWAVTIALLIVLK